MTVSEIKEICERYGIVAQKRWGQNFLADMHTIDRIIDTSEIGADDFILEIGPGVGSLTESLSKRARFVLCIEIDPVLSQYLTERFLGNRQIEVIHQDFLAVSSETLIRRYGHPNIIVSNLPYNLTTPIILTLLGDYPNTRKMVYTVEEDACDRIFSIPSTKSYGPISIVSSIFGEKKKHFSIPANHFYPAPHTVSAVITFSKHMNETILSPLFVSFVRGAMTMRRKTIVNALQSVPLLIGQSERIRDVIDAEGISASARAESLTPGQFVHLYRALFPDI